MRKKPNPANSSPWRYKCARCGSRALAQNAREPGWVCHGKKHGTPAIYDLLKETWIHIFQFEDNVEPVPTNWKVEYKNDVVYPTDDFR